MSLSQASMPAYGFQEFSGIGVAPEAEGIQQKFKKLLEHYRMAVSIGHPFTKQSVIVELDEIMIECSQNNWDGYGAKAISITTYSEALKIIDMLNSYFSDIPLPELTPIPDGDIGFEWFDNGNTFAFSIDDNKTLTYAGIFGINKIHGQEILGDFIPKIIVENIKRLHSK